jgi:hypothetical protein
VLGRYTPIAELGKEKFAVTEVFENKPTVQFPVPVQPPPLHPKKRARGSAVAVSVMEVPLGSLSEQVVPHWIFEDELVTVPRPDFVTERT